MTLTQKLFLAGAGLAMAAVAGYLWLEQKRGHDDPITVDNPNLSVDFGHKGDHKLKLDRDGSGNAQMMRRDITEIVAVYATFRNSANAVKLMVKTDSEIVLEVSKGPDIPVAVIPHFFVPDELGMRVRGQFGKCENGETLKHCEASDKDSRLQGIQYTTFAGEQKHLCFDDGKSIDPKDKCPKPDTSNPNPAGIYFKLKPH